MIAKGGTVTIYDARGRCIIKTRYRNARRRPPLRRRGAFVSDVGADAINPPIIH
ncbi:MAG: hypothetical protein R3E54_06165 [Halioglobus sp.]